MCNSTALLVIDYCNSHRLINLSLRLSLTLTHTTAVPRAGYCETYATPDPWPPCYRPPHYCRYDEDCDKAGQKCCATNFCGGKTCKEPMKG